MHKKKLCFYILIENISKRKTKKNQWNQSNFFIESNKIEFSHFAHAKTDIGLKLFIVSLY